VLERRGRRRWDHSALGLRVFSRDKRWTVTAYQGGRCGDTAWVVRARPGRRETRRPTGPPCPRARVCKRIPGIATRPARL
jgi:hypothetical protein